MKKLWIIILPVLFLLAIIIDILFSTKQDIHGNMWWVNFNLFYIAMGLIGCVVMIYVAKWVAKHWLDRGERYYD